MHKSWRFLLTQFVDLKTRMLQSHWQCMSTQVAAKEFFECGKRLPLRIVKANHNLATTFTQLDAATTLSRV